MPGASGKANNQLTLIKNRIPRRRFLNIFETPII
jgi:hypothetical protein